jgi:hypothetical protein
VKNKTAVFLAVGLFSVFFVLSGLAGAQEQKAQLYSVTEVVVKPALAAQFEAGVKKEIELGYPYPYSAYSTDDFYYYFLVPIENYAGIDAMNKAEGEWSAKAGQEYEAMMKSLAGAVVHYRSGVVRFLPELSYAPKKPRFKAEEEKFITWGFAYLEFGKDKEFADIAKQFVEICKTKDTSIGWNMYVVQSGTEMPLYFWAEGGKSAADYWGESDKVIKKMGEEKYGELWNRMSALLRKYETKTGRPRPDLSNLPKK